MPSIFILLATLVLYLIVVAVVWWGAIELCKQFAVEAPIPKIINVVGVLAVVLVAVGVILGGLPRLNF